MENRQIIYSTQFWLLCLSSLLFFGSFNMMIPELPAFLSQMGGAEYKGYIISLFTLTALLSRPFSGKLADTIGRKPVIAFGALVCFIASITYSFIESVSAFLVLRLLHGFSTGFSPTGVTALLSDIIPAERRGEAMGILGTAGSLGMALGPTVGGAIVNNFSMDAMFYTSAGFALLALMIVANIRETLHVRSKFSIAALKVQRKDLFEPRVWLPCIVMVLTAFSYGAVFTVIPDFGEHTGITNKGLLFGCLTVASLTVRLLAGKASDRFGRKAILRVSTLIIAVSMTGVAFSESAAHLMIFVTLYGFGQGMTSPTLLAWATDLSDDRHKGRGIASLYIAMEFGIGIGALLSGFIFANKIENFFQTFFTCSMLGILALIMLIVPIKKQRATN